MGCSSKDAFPASQIDDFVMRQLYRLMTGSDRDDFIEVEFVDGHSVINPYVINAPQANVMAMSAAVAALSYVFMSRLLVGKNKEMRLRKTTASSSSYTTLCTLSRKRPAHGFFIVVLHDAMRRCVTHAVRAERTLRGQRPRSFLLCKPKAQAFRSVAKPKPKWGGLFEKVGEGYPPTRFSNFSRISNVTYDI